MVKFTCDKCHKEFTPDKYFMEGKIVVKKIIFRPQQTENPVQGQLLPPTLVHLCEKCTETFENDFLNDEKGS